jgi:hypothetical protein
MGLPGDSNASQASDPMGLPASNNAGMTPGDELPPMP